jgi:hypothetical protein
MVPFFPGSSAPSVHRMLRRNRKEASLDVESTFAIMK